MKCDLCGNESDQPRCDRCKSYIQASGSDARSHHRPGSAQPPPKGRSRGRQCASCDQPAPHGVTICKLCEHATKRRLVAQEAHRRELLTTLAKMGRTTPPADGGRKADPALSWSKLGPLFLEPGFDVHGVPLPTVWDAVARNPVAVPFIRSAANELHAQRRLLVTWCRLLHEEREVPLPEDRIVAMAGHLYGHMPILRLHEAAGELVNDLAALTSSMVATYGAPAMSGRSAELGPCPLAYPSENGDVPCTGKVSAFYAEAPYLLCSVCGYTWDSTQWTRASRLILRLRKQREVSSQPPAA